MGKNFEPAIFVSNIISHRITYESDDTSLTWKQI